MKEFRRWRSFERLSGVSDSEVRRNQRRRGPDEGPAAAKPETGSASAGK